MGTKFRKDMGDLNPDFVAAGSFRREISPPDGILKRLDFYTRGDHTTNITTGQVDGQLNIFSSFQVTAPRKNGLRPLVWNVLPRDLAWITALMDGQRAANANPANTTEVHYDMFSIFLAPPDRLCETPDDFGLDTAELSGPIIVEGQYGAVTSIGTGSTAVTNKCSVAAVFEQRAIGADGKAKTPFAAMAGNSMRLANESASRLGPDAISVSNIEFLWSLFLRQHDNSAAAAQRVDGLVTRYIIEHSAEGILVDEFAQSLKKATGLYFGLAAADLPAGIAMPVFGPRANIADMAYMGPNKLTLIHDGAETVPVEVTDVTPGASDAVYAVSIGAMLSGAGKALLGQAA